MTRIFALPACTQSYDWVKLGSTSKAAAYARVATRSTRTSRTRRSGAISFCGSLLFTLLLSPVFPTDACNISVEGRIRCCRRSSCRAAWRPSGERLRKNAELLGTRESGSLPSCSNRSSFAIHLAFNPTQTRSLWNDRTPSHQIYSKVRPPFRLITILLFLLFYHRQSTDPNHKPEMVIALTPFRAMCGFREPNDTREFVLDLSPELFALGDISIVQYILCRQLFDGDLQTLLRERHMTDAEISRFQLPSSCVIAREG
jgi:hypothetical protein